MVDIRSRPGTEHRTGSRCGVRSTSASAGERIHFRPLHASAIALVRRPSDAPLRERAGAYAGSGRDSPRREKTARQRSAGIPASLQASVRTRLRSCRPLRQRSNRNRRPAIRPYDERRARARCRRRGCPTALAHALQLARHAQRRCVPRYRGPFRPASISPAKVRSRGSQVPRPRHVRLSAPAVRRQPAQRRSRRVPTLSRRASKPQRACGPKTVRFLPVCAQSSRTFDTHTDQNRPRRPMNTSFDDKRAFSCSSRALTRLTNVLKPVSTLPMST
jgi:hypothetical protein